MPVQFFDPLFRFPTSRDYNSSIPGYYRIIIVLFAALLSYRFLTNRQSKMLLPFTIPLLATTLFTTSAAAGQTTDNAKSTSIKDAVTRVLAYEPLSDSDFVYDFNNLTPDPFSPGSVFFATGATWPILAGGNMALSVINMGPCAMLSPHTHPRATKIAIAITGSIRTWMRPENGAADRVTYLTPGKSTIFTKGATHTMTNEGCTNAILYSFFDHSDPGTMSIAQGYMATGPDIGETCMPFILQVDGDWNKTAAEVPDIGLGAQPGTGACKKRCGIF